jgi:hypothetical protein
MPTESGCYASRLPLHRPETGPSHGRANAMRRCGKYGPSTPCFSSRESGRRRNMVSLLSGGMGILLSMPSRHAFPSSANSPVCSLLTSGHSLGAGPAPHHPSTQRSRAGDPDSAAHRCSASFATANALRVWASSNKFPAQRTRWKFLAGASAESTSRPWERGTLASLRARVSRRQSGQIQTGEMTWHSTKTKSL